MQFPEKYEEEMKGLLGKEEYAHYEEAFSRPASQGIRVNTLKISPEAFEARMASRGHLLKKVTWCPCGYLYEDETSLYSKSPDYAAGLYYLQEPSAMAPASLLPVEPGDWVLDLCAAPGGKSTMLSSRLGQTGMLFSNDISPSRAQALLKNMELFGAWRSVILSEPSYKLVQRFPRTFDKILVDAPCSGEGMFRKEPEIMKNWEQYGSAYYAKMQKEILEAAYQMLIPGGMMVYSTCTFSPEEDEKMVASFLSRHGDMNLVPVPKTGGMEDGRPAWANVNREGEPFPARITSQLTNTARFWPQKTVGEGHFTALFQKEGSPSEPHHVLADETGIGSYSAQDLSLLTQFASQTFSRPLQEILPKDVVLQKIGTNLYLTPVAQGCFSGLRILRCGLLLGELKKDRFEPSQALAMALHQGDCVRELSLPAGSAALSKYLKGETLSSDTVPVPGDGWTLVLDEEYPVGWGKGVHGMLKNKYLKGWIAR